MKSLNELSNLSGRRALVTGGAGFIALAVEETLLELGADLAITDLNGRNCDGRAETLSRGRSKGVLSLGADLSDEKAARRVVQESVAKMGGLDILVHCAAHVGTDRLPGWAVPFDHQTVQAWDDAIRINLTSAFVLVQQARSALSGSGHGAVILISSIYGIVGPDFRLYENTAMANPAAYGASKGGLLQLTKYLATLLAPHVRVNAVSTGGVWRDQPEPFHKAYVSRTPLQRMATEEDLKGAIAYLASDLSAYVTGHNLVVDGGWTAW